MCSGHKGHRSFGLSALYAIAVVVLAGPAIVARWYYQYEVVYTNTGQLPPYASAKWTYTPAVAQSIHDLHAYVGQLGAQDVAHGTNTFALAAFTVSPRVIMDLEAFVYEQQPGLATIATPWQHKTLPTLPWQWSLLRRGGDPPFTSAGGGP